MININWFEKKIAFLFFLEKEGAILSKVLVSP